MPRPRKEIPAAEPSVVVIPPTLENREQSYRQNLTWALESAGEFLRTKTQPTVCPNNSAWFLYVQAMNEPKDFMAKYFQIEKNAESEESEKETKDSTLKILHGVEDFLIKLEKRNGKEKESEASAGASYQV